MKLLPVHSTLVVTTTLVDLELAHTRQVRVLTLNTPPLGTSGVLVVVTMEMYLSGSIWSSSSVISHFVCFGPIPPFKGLI